MRDFDFSGTYDTRVTLVSTECSGVSVRSALTVVEHAPGTTRLKLTHGGVPFDASVQPNGHFSTVQPGAGTSSGAQVTTVVGRFTQSGFSASVRTELTYPRICVYQTRWSGSAR